MPVCYKAGGPVPFGRVIFISCRRQYFAVGVIKARRLAALNILPWFDFRRRLRPDPGETGVDVDECDFANLPRRQVAETEMMKRRPLAHAGQLRPHLHGSELWRNPDHLPNPFSEINRLTLP
jgi:hypothetical protein